MNRIVPSWLEGVRTVGITAGASAPEHLVSQVVEFFKNNGTKAIEELTVIPEDVRFGLPAEIKSKLVRVA